MEKQKPELDSWGRKYYEPGGGDALLFYVVYGRADTTAPLSRSNYRSDGIPAGLDVMAYGPQSNPEVPGSFLEGYLWEQLRSEKPEMAENISAQDSCIILRGTFPDPPDLNYLRDTIGLITHFLDHGGVAVYDPQMFQWWSPDKWRQRIFDPAGPVPRHHTVILVSGDSGGTEWLHTRGLRKFGRPDLSIPRVPEFQKNAFIDLCNRFIELQAFGGVIPEGQRIRMPSLPDGLVCHHEGDLEDPDFNNVHVRIAQENSEY
ncbi:MAG: hypothetical protein KA419_13885 [Acidobacteria bacterium]|nr:hypothetical protein [Acidobacteriota bacterium]